MMFQARLSMTMFALVLSGVIVSAPVSAAEYTLKWGVVTRGDMQEKFGNKLAEVFAKGNERPRRGKGFFQAAQLRQSIGAARRLATRYWSKLLRKSS